MQHCLGLYKELINGFLKNGYEAISFSSVLTSEKQLIIRHDIDFDCRYALEISEIENTMGVHGTYFFLLCSDSYNLLSKDNARFVRCIKENGHTVSLHFDPTLYGKDFLKGFQYEREIFEKTFETKLEIISIHRPNSFFLNYDETLNGVEHTYQKKFSKEIKYISDSQGVFRFGHPFKTKEFQQGKTIHLLTHPIWWQCQGSSNIDILDNYVDQRQSFLHAHIGRNCIPYQDYLDKK